MTDKTMPASRLAAELAKSTSVRRASIQFDHRIMARVTDDGMSRTNMNTIRSYGWEVSGFTMRSNSVSIVRSDREGQS